MCLQRELGLLRLGQSGDGDFRARGRLCCDSRCLRVKMTIDWGLPLPPQLRSPPVEHQATPKRLRKQCFEQLAAHVLAAPVQLDPAFCPPLIRPPSVLPPLTVCRPPSTLCRPPPVRPGCLQLGMPPRSGLTSSFSVTDANNEVVCPLKNHDGSSCRKRCIGVSSPSGVIPQLPLTRS